MEQQKVAILYRVSTERQGAEGDDIPMQRVECQAFAKKNNWQIIKELTEKQSGYSIAIEDRETLHQIRQMAQEGQINTVLAYMSDRIGRQTEIAGFVQGLALLGVKVYTVKEGLISGGTHGDNLMTYIRFWMAEGESMKTSERVKDSMKQYNEEGLFMGGVVPYGYKLVDTGEKYNSKKTKTIKKIVPDESEAEVVKLVFNLVFEKGFGASRISQYLNDQGYTNRGNIFRHNTIGRMLRNPVYTGYKRFNMTERMVRSKKVKVLDKDEWKLQPYNAELVIIPEPVFQRVQEILDSRVKSKASKGTEPSATPSEVLLSGLVMCGKCGHKMYSDYTVKSYTRKSDGVTTKRKVYRYTCNHAKNLKGHGKKQWGSKSLDQMVEEQVLNVISGIKFDDLDAEIKAYKDTHLGFIEKELNQVSALKTKTQRGLENAKQELKKIMMGDSVFTREDISEMIQTFTTDLDQYSQKEQELQGQLDDNQLSLGEVENLKQRFSTFGDIYNEADLDQRKMLLSSVVKEVLVFNEKIIIHFRIGINEAISEALAKGNEQETTDLKDGEMWLTGEDWGCVDTPLPLGIGTVTHPQNAMSIAELLKHKVVEFMVELSASTLEKIMA